MLVFIDDGSTNIKLQWQESDGTIKQHISPNSFKREWAVSFGVYLGVFWVLSGFVCQAYPILTINQ